MIGLESENLKIDQDVTLNLSLSNLEISSTAIQRLTSNTHCLTLKAPAGGYIC